MAFATVAIVGGIAAGAAAIGKTAYGIHQTHHGNKILREAEKNRPKYGVNPILQNNANFGFGQQATNYYTENINRGLGSGINAILAGGGDLNMINSLVGGATNAYKQYAIADAQQKLVNQGMLVNEQRQAWNYDKNIPNMQQYYRGVQQTNSGAQNIYGGLTDLAGAGTSMATMGMSGQTSGLSQNPYVASPSSGYAAQPYQNPYQTNPLTSSWYQSDIRLKENYSVVGKSASGINIYEFSYKGNPTRYRGVMSHEVPFASILNDNGYYSVDYSMIDVNFEQV